MSTSVSKREGCGVREGRGGRGREGERERGRGEAEGIFDICFCINISISIYLYDFSGERGNNESYHTRMSFVTFECVMSIYEPVISHMSSSRHTHI